MPTNLITQCNPQSTTSGGVTYNWASDKTYCICNGTTGTALSVSNIVPSAGNISNTPFRAGRTYHLEYPNPVSAITIQCYCYPQSTGTYNARFLMSGSQDFTIPDPCVRLTLRVRVANNSTVGNTIYPEIYDVTNTAVNNDLYVACGFYEGLNANNYDNASGIIGYNDNFFYPIFESFAPGMWDGEPCSEIACCISYMAGNLSAIYVSNYAQGLVDLYQNNQRFGHVPSLGAFIWFDYGDGNGPSHTGRVVGIENGIIYTVEGNIYDHVVKRTYSINSPLIYGYGYPDYPDTPEPPTPPVPPAPPIGKRTGKAWLMLRNPSLF